MKTVVPFSERLKIILDIVEALINFKRVKFTIQVLVTEVENDTNEGDEHHASLDQASVENSNTKKMQSQVHSDIELNSIDFGVLLFMVLLGTSINRQSELINGLLGLKVLHHQGRVVFEKHALEIR